jgi:hypothetical protein
MLVHLRPLCRRFDHRLDPPQGDGLWPVRRPTTLLTVGPPRPRVPLPPMRDLDPHLGRDTFRPLKGHYSSLRSYGLIASHSGLSPTSV